MNVSVKDEIQLKKAENAWKPGMKREGPADDPDMIKTQVGPNIHTDIQANATKDTPRRS